MDNITDNDEITIEGAAIGNINAKKHHRSKGRKAKVVVPHPRALKPKAPARSKPVKIKAPKKAVKTKITKPKAVKAPKIAKPKKAKALKVIKPKTVKAPKLKTAKAPKQKAVKTPKNMNVVAKKKGTNLKGGKQTKPAKVHTSKMRMKV